MFWFTEKGAIKTPGGGKSLDAEGKGIEEVSGNGGKWKTTPSAMDILVRGGNTDRTRRGREETVIRQYDEKGLKQS